MYEDKRGIKQLSPLVYFFPNMMCKEVEKIPMSLCLFIVFEVFLKMPFIILFSCADVFLNHHFYNITPVNVYSTCFCNDKKRS